MREKPKMELVGHDGNIFFILGRASTLLWKAGMEEQADEMERRVRSCGDYYEALNIISEYVETELSPTAEIKRNSRRKDDFER